MPPDAHPLVVLRAPAVSRNSCRFAALIDAGNASARITDGLFEEIAKIRKASVRRICGDFASARSKALIDALSRHAIIPKQQFAYATEKKASDITLVIDTMDRLHSGRFDGLGEQKTPESFRHACRSFIYTENLLPAA